VILAILLALQAAPAPGVDAGDDIVVIGQRLQRDFRANLRFQADGPQCRVTRSTGDAELDRIGCAAMTTCFPQFQSRFQASGDRAISPKTRKVMQAALNAELTSCVTGQHKTLIADLRAKRRVAKAPS